MNVQGLPAPAASEPAPLAVAAPALVSGLASVQLQAEVASSVPSSPMSSEGSVSLASLMLEHWLLRSQCPQLVLQPLPWLEQL